MTTNYAMTERYPITSHSWAILNSEHALKEGDVSCFEHDGTAIPKDVTSFFKFDPLEGKRNVKLVFGGNDYEGTLIPDSRARARLFWRGGLAAAFRCYRKGGSNSPADWQIHFRRKVDVPNVFWVDLVEKSSRKQAVPNTPERFKAGFAPRRLSTAYARDSQAIEVNLYHNALQHALYEELVKKYGFEQVGTEFDSGNGTRVDVVVKVGGEFQYFEIKTEYSAKACLRQAIGQLLEYSFWPGATAPNKIVVAGPAPLDRSALAYIAELRKRFKLPLEYVKIAAFNECSTEQEQSAFR